MPKQKTLHLTGNRGSAKVPPTASLWKFGASWAEEHVITHKNGTTVLFMLGCILVLRDSVAHDADGRLWGLVREVHRLGVGELSVSRLASQP